MTIRLETIAVLAELKKYGIDYQWASGAEVKILCPFHKEHNPSCHVNTEKRNFYCHTAGCNASGDFVSLLARQTNESRAVVILDLAQRYDIEDDKTIDILAVERWHEEIWKADALRLELYRRGITDEQIRFRRFGVNDGRITIPVYNRSHAVVNVRKYLPGAPGAEKMKNTRGYGKIRWFCIEQLKYDKILLAGGECKALVAQPQLNPANIGAISATCGEDNLPVELIQDLAGKHVYICMDIDDAGKNAAIKHSNAIRMIAAAVYIINLPLDPDKHPKGDLNDFVATENGLILPLIEAATEYVPTYIEHMLIDTSPAIDVPLNLAVHADNSGKRMRVKGMVSAIDTTPYLVPRDVRVVCTKKEPYCTLCPVFIKKKEDWTIPPESPAILEFVGSDSNHHARVLKQTIGIPIQCGVSQFSRLSEYNVEDTRISPQLELTNNFGDRQPIPALCIGSGLALNEAYELTGKLIAHPRTQQATLLISSYEASQDALSTYTLENAEALSIFWPRELSREGISERLSSIYEDLEFNATRIWGRRDLHLAVDLTFHSPLLIEFERQQEKGWIELLILGDSSNGKSRCVEKLRDYYSLGETVDCAGCTVAGLLGGVIKMGDRWFVSWGAIPNNDRRIVFLEEVKDAPEGAIIKLKETRGSGIASLAKIGKHWQTYARTRAVWISNPANDCKISSYPYGVFAIKELMEDLPSIRRFDFAVITTEMDVAKEELNRSIDTRPEVKNTYTPELCRQLVLWAWTRTRDQIKFTKDAELEILDQANKLGAEFSDAIPLLDRGSSRFKLARLSAALAARLFSCSEDYQNVVVEYTHVQYIADYLRRMYNAQTFGYSAFSKAQEILTTLLDPEQLQETIKKLAFPKDFCQSMLAQDYIEVQDLADWADADQATAQTLLSLFVRKHALVRRGRYYRKTPPFIELLKIMVDGDLPPGPEKKERF
jgi:hypothetical protein